MFLASPSGNNQLPRKRRCPVNEKRERQPQKQKGADPVRVKSSRKHYNSIHFKEVVGKTIASFEQVMMDEEGAWNLEIFFTDGTVMLLDLSARLEIRAQLMKQKDGTRKPLRHYGKLGR
jgi:hypothetical protein